MSGFKQPLEKVGIFFTLAIQKETVITTDFEITEKIRSWGGYRPTYAEAEQNEVANASYV